MVDALLAFKPRWEASPILDRLPLDGKRYAVLTLHRPTNVDDPDTLNELLGALQEIGRHLPIVFPVHPRVRPRLALGASASNRGLVCLPPLGYLDFVALMSRARLVLPDSRVVQAETPMLGAPCPPPRHNTQHPVTL